MAAIEVYGIPGFREPFSCFSHLLGAVGFAILGGFLIHRGRGHFGRVLSLAVMVFCSVFLLSMSGVYHLLGEGTARHVMRMLDIAGVFGLIAGTVTPVHAILFKGWQRWVPLILVWASAVTGITLRTVFSDGLPAGVGTIIFLVMGWGGAISCVLLWRRYGFAFVKPLIWGGVAYSVGAIILLAKWPIVIPGVICSHELWHIAVLVGLAMHWQFVFSFADGRAPESLKSAGLPK